MARSCKELAPPAADSILPGAQQISNPPPVTMSHPPEKPASSNFLRAQIEADIARGTYAGRLWSGQRSIDSSAPLMADPARIRTRFPPEPNGYLHIGHAKSICLNFGLARDYDGVCHMRFDDTNPVREDQEYVDSIQETIHWLGFDWAARPFETALAKLEDHLYFASDYFEDLYRFAEYLITMGHAYVDSDPAEMIRERRGTLTAPGIDSPYRARSVAENLELFRAMRAGEYPDGAHVLRARIDMSSPNINLRDPVLYRIRHAEHHRTGNSWCIYPMYDYTHCLSDALEDITHSICTLEFEDHRPLYDWVLERTVPILRPIQFRRAVGALEQLQERGIEAQKEFALHCHQFKHKLDTSPPEVAMRVLFDRWEHDQDAVLSDLQGFFKLLLEHAEQFAPLLTHALDDQIPNPFALPHQHEFARLHLNYFLSSKRKLLQLVQEGHVDGWDDPRLATLVGLRRRGYTPESIQLFCERVGVARADSWIDHSVLEQAVRDDLDEKAPRATAVLNPVRLVLDNYPEGQVELCSAPVHPHHEEMGRREFPFSRELWIEAEDFTETPAKGYFRLFPGNKVRLRHGYVIECVGAEKDAQGRIIAVHANYLPETRSGTPGADSIKVKGNIHWVSRTAAVCAQVRLYERLFNDPQPDAAGKDFLDAINPDSKKVLTAYLEPGMEHARADTRYQFERHGYFTVDHVDSKPGEPVFNRIVTLKDSFGPAKR
jgi:glutaminyl-tRNA synthetase